MLLGSGIERAWQGTEQTLASDETVKGHGGWEQTPSGQLLIGRVTLGGSASPFPDFVI